MKKFVLPALVAAAALLILATIALAGSGGGGRAVPPLPPEGVAVPAPIDGVEVVIRESMPPQVAAHITAGLPSGCAKQGTYSVDRSGDTITVTVLNTMPAGDPICTMIYGQYELMIELGSDFEVGKTYTLKVNDTETTFKT